MSRITGGILALCAVLGVIALIILLQPQPALAQKQEMPPVLCSMTMDEAVSQLTANGMEHEIVDDPARLATEIAAVKEATGVDETGATRALIGYASNHTKIGFEDVDGCLQPNPYYLAVRAPPVKA